MRLITTTLTAVLLSAGAGRAEHLTVEQLARHEIQTQDQQEFVTQFKKFTGLELTGQVLTKLKFFATAAAVTVDMAEMNRTKPTWHDPLHCNREQGSCFEQWKYENAPDKFGVEKGAEFTKLVTSDLAGNLEATMYCHGKVGVISCTTDVQNGRTLKKYYWFGLKNTQGLAAQIYALD